MADVPPPEPPPPDPSNPDDPRATSENEIDKLLAEATALANELALDLGAPAAEAVEEGPGDPTAPAENQAKDITESLDDELSQLSSLLDKTGADVGGAPVDPAEPAPAEVGNVATFMDDLTHPEVAESVTGLAAETSASSAADEVPPPAEHPTDADVPLDSPPSDSTPTTGKPPVTTPRKIGVVSTADLGVTGKVNSFPPQPIEDEPDAAKDGGANDAIDDEATVSHEEPSAGRKLALMLSRLVAVVSPLARQLSPLALEGCARGVRVLELVDRPLARIGPRVRRIAGWLGIATVGTSVLVYLVSLF